MDSTSFSFEPFYLNIKRQCLQKNTEDIKISPRMFELLHILAKASPEPVSKKQLNSSLWPNTIVSEWSLARLVSDTRILLGDNGEQQKYIQTLRGKGFCLANVIRHHEKNSKEKTNSKTSWLFAISTILLIIGGIFYAKSVAKHELQASIERISIYQEHSYAAFKAQLERRKQLSHMLEKRLNIKRKRQWEMFFAHYHKQMNTEELFVCDQIRAITYNGLFKNNQAIFNELVQHQKIFNEIALSKKLSQHLHFWLNKYHSVFEQRADMCLLYVGVEDGIPYPSGVDKNIKTWLASQ